MTAKKAAAKKPAKKVYKPTSTVTVSIRVMGQTYEAKGKTLTEALDGLHVRNARGSAVLIVTQGTRRIEKILGRLVVMRLFSPSPTMRQLALKNLYFLCDL